MGLGQVNAKGRNSAFSRDILKIEIQGPEEQHYSVIDVPGIFRVKTEGVTTDEDRDMVQQMVAEYMNNPRSIILAVIPANIDTATQGILTMANDADAEGNRTIGVLTKPDLVDKGAERAVLDLVNGKKHKLKLGWYIVRNLSQEQLTSRATNRDTLELDFFRTTAPWNTIDEENVGIKALKARLHGVLTSAIRREFPKV